MAERVELRRRRRSSDEPSGWAPSATTTIGAYRVWNRCSTYSQTCSMSNGCSGIRITFAPPAMPACSAIQPACRPIPRRSAPGGDSRRWCAAGRSPPSRCSPLCRTRRCSRSPPRSLSMVFGTPTTRPPASSSLAATPRVSSPPIATRASTPRLSRFSLIRSMPVLPSTVLDSAAGIGPRGAKNRAAPGQDAAYRGDVQHHGVALERAAPAVPEADELQVVLGDAGPHDRTDHRVQSRTIAAAGQDSHSHASSSLAFFAVTLVL